jgi:hypothetical protein
MPKIKNLKALFALITLLTRVGRFAFASFLIFLALPSFSQTPVSGLAASDGTFANEVQLTFTAPSQAYSTCTDVNYVIMRDGVDIATVGTAHCTSRVLTTYAPTITYSCAAGQTVLGNQCIWASTVPAVPLTYSCPAGFSLSGTICNQDPFPVPLTGDCPPQQVGSTTFNPWQFYDPYPTGLWTDGVNVKTTGPGWVIVPPGVYVCGYTGNNYGTTIGNMYYWIDPAQPYVGSDNRVNYPRIGWSVDYSRGQFHANGVTWAVRGYPNDGAFELIPNNFHKGVNLAIFA